MKWIIFTTVLLAGVCTVCTAQSPDLKSELVVSNNQGASQIVTFGLNPDATTNIDTALGENELPPLPPQGIFDARFISSELQQVELGQGSYMDLRPGDVSTSGQVEYELRYQSNSGDSIIISWNLPDSIIGSLEDIFGGSMIKQKISGGGELLVDNPSIFDKLKLKIQYKALALPPDKPEQLSPAMNAENIDIAPKLLWRQASNAQSYNLSCYLVNDSLQKIFEQTGLADTVFQLPELQPLHVYEWRIQATNSGLQSDWNSRRFMTKAAVLQPPEIPVALSPLPGAVDVSLSPRLVWQEQENCDSFALQVYFAGSFSKLILDKNAISDTAISIENLQAGAVYFWRLRAVNTAGVSEWTPLIQFKTQLANAVNEKENVPALQLYPNYPNPFNPQTNLRFSLDRSRTVTVKIFDIQGCLVTTLVDERMGPGNYHYIWDATSSSSGKYFAVLSADNHRFVRPLMLVK